MMGKCPSDYICKVIGKFFEKILFIPSDGIGYSVKDTEDQTIVRVSVNPYSVFGNEFILEKVYKELEKKDILEKLRKILSAASKVSFQKIQVQLFSPPGTSSFSIVFNYI